MVPQTNGEILGSIRPQSDRDVDWHWPTSLLRVTYRIARYKRSGLKISPRSLAEASFSCFHNHLSTTCLDKFLRTADQALYLVQLLTPSD
jgi:hypothetical protein